MVKFTTEQGTIEFETIEDLMAFQKEMTPPTEVKLEINCPDDIEAHIEESLKGHYLQDQVFLNEEDAVRFVNALETPPEPTKHVLNAWKEYNNLFEDNVNMDEMLTEVFGEGYMDNDFKINKDAYVLQEGICPEEYSRVLQRLASAEALPVDILKEKALGLLGTLGFNTNCYCPLSFDEISLILQRLGTAKLLPKDEDFQKWLLSILSVDEKAYTPYFTETNNLTPEDLQDFTCPCCAEMEEDEPETEYNLRLTESEMLRLWTLLGFVAKDEACSNVSDKLEDMLQHVDEELLDNSEAVVLVSEENPILDGTPLVALGEHVIFTD
ncbi:MAG: hypothetical protein GY928_04065 [Colwellia sp.]|nr:hypothetical protein [Colwellia sp.]